jgi:hypothetical protein
MVRAGLLVLALAGCGRLAFEPGQNGTLDGDTIRPDCAFDLCEDFEATLDTSLWTVDSTVTRDTSVARGGIASARMHVDALAPNQPATAALTESRTLASSREMWVRSWLRLSALPAGTNELELIGLAQSGSADAVHSVIVRADQVGLAIRFNGISATTNVVLPLDTWFCLVWHARLATNGGAMDLAGDLFDGPEIGGQTDVAPPISALRFGIRFASSKVTVTQPPLDVWLDDVIVHSAPVSCAD